MSHLLRRGWDNLSQTVVGTTCPHIFLLISALGLLASTVSAIVDINQNGLSDLWEKQHNDGDLFPETFDPQADPDADGWSNAREAAAGTDPLDANPPGGHIRPNIIQTPAVIADQNGDGELEIVSPVIVTVSWPTIVGKQYTLWYSPDLTEGSWLTVDQPFIGDGDIHNFHFQLQDEDKMFWRVAVADTDTDGDGLADAEEANLGTDSRWWDSDGDGLADLDEVLNGYSPLIKDEDADGVPDGWGDSDLDGYSDLEELAAGTNPRDSSLKPDGISTDTLLVRNATLSMTQVGARGSKDFAFRELKPAAAATDGEGDSPPKFYLVKSDLSGFCQEIDYYTKHIYWDSSGTIYPDMTALWSQVGANEEFDETGRQWERGAPTSPNTAAVPYCLTETYDSRIERSITLTSKGYTMPEPGSVTLSYRTGDPEEDYFNFSSWTDGSEDPVAWDVYQSFVRISEDSPETWESIDSASGHYSYSDEAATSRDSYARNSTTKTTLSSEYTDTALSADVDQALSEARAAAAGGTSPGITGSAAITSRGIADHQWSADRINHLKMDSKVRLSTTVTQSGVRKVVFLWSELLRPDPATPGGAAPEARLNIRRVEKTGASTYGVGSTVDTGEIEVSHPAEPGYIEIPGASIVDAPDQLQVTPGSHSANPPFPPLGTLHVHSSLPDRGIPVTLEKTGDAQIRIWKEQDGSFSQVVLPYTLEADQKAGRTSRPALLHIQALSSGNARLALKAQGQEIAYKSIRAFEFDLDADSDNSGQIDATPAEDAMECTSTVPGVIIIPNGEGDADVDGTPNRDDLDNAGEFTPIRISLANLGPSQRVVFRYSMAGIETQTTSGGLRLWKKNGNVTRTSSDLIESNGQGYTAADLGISGGGSATFYLEAVSDLGGAQVLSIETSGASDAVKVFPFTLQTVSRDKYLAGTLEIPAGWDDLTAEFVNTASLENLGTYGDLAGGGTTKIYDSVDDIMNEADILAGSQPGTQKVWFVRSGGNPRKLDFYTCFNSVGAVEVRLARGGQNVLTRSHALTTADDFAETIRYVDDWVKGVGFEFSEGGGTVPAVMGAPPVNGFGGGGGIDNLTRAALIPFFNVINQVEGLQNITVGLFDGFKAGLNDDWELVLLVKNGAVAAGGWAWQQAETELLEWKNNPVKRAGELKSKAMRVCKDWVFEPLKDKRRELSTWDGFKNQSWKVWKSVKGTPSKAWTVTRNSWGDICNGFSSWMDDFGARMIEGAEKTHWSESVFPMDNFQQIGNAAVITGCYALGYSTGYIVEQVAMGVVTGGVVKAGVVMTKGGVKMAGLLAARRVLPVAARLQLVKKWAASVAMSVEMKAAVERGLTEAAKVPLTTTVTQCPLEVLENTMARVTFNRAAYSSRNLIDDLTSKPKLKELLLSAGREALVKRRAAQLAYLLGDECDDVILRNFMKVADESIVIKHADGTLDDFFEGFFRSFEGNPGLMTSAEDATFTISGLSANGKATLKKFLSDPNAGKLWDIDVPAIVDNEPAIPHNYWVRGILGELSIYKKVYKKAGYTHAPTAAGYDFTGPAWVQVKTLKNPDGAYGAMKKAVDKLIAESPTDKPLKLHILKKPGSSSDQLSASLTSYINGLAEDVRSRLSFEIEPFELPQ